MKLAEDGGLEVELDLRNRALKLIGEKMFVWRLASGPNLIYQQTALGYVLAMLEFGAITQQDYDDLHKEISGW